MNGEKQPDKQESLSLKRETIADLTPKEDASGDVKGGVNGYPTGGGGGAGRTTTGGGGAGRN